MTAAAVGVAAVLFLRFYVAPRFGEVVSELIEGGMLTASQRVADATFPWTGLILSVDGDTLATVDSAATFPVRGVTVRIFWISPAIGNAAQQNFARRLDDTTFQLLPSPSGSEPIGILANADGTVAAKVVPARDE